MLDKKVTPQERWQKKVGLISKSYKLNSTLVEQFADACKKVNISQAQQLSKLMQNFIDTIEN